VAVHLAALDGDLLPGLFEFGGLGGKAGCGLGGLSGAMLQFGMAGVELRVALEDGLTDLAQLALPFGDLLAEGGDLEAVLVAGHL
jgi:hypothetical protein